MAIREENNSGLTPAPHSSPRLKAGASVRRKGIGEMEAGNTVPTVFVAKRLARALGVTVDELITEEE